VPVLFLHCPRCRLVIETKRHEPLIERCPRCLARSRALVELRVSSSRQPSSGHMHELPDAAVGQPRELDRGAARQQIVPGTPAQTRRSIDD
jgi:hypothetical protein